MSISWYSPIKRAFGDGPHTGQVEPVPPIAPRGDPAQRRVAVSHRDDWNLPVAQWFRIDPHGVEPDELAVERSHVIPPQGPHGRDVFGSARGAPLERHTQRVEFLTRPADADAEREPTTAQGVQRRRLFGDQHRIVLRQQQHAGRDADARRGGGGETQSDHRVDSVGGGRHCDLTIVGIRIAGPWAVHHHDMLTRPQRGETTPLRRRRERIDHRAVGSRTDAQNVQSQPHRAIVSGFGHPLPDRGTGVGTHPRDPHAASATHRMGS
jgi:hypothetical protein